MLHNPHSQFARSAYEKLRNESDLWRQECARDGDLVLKLLDTLHDVAKEHPQAAGLTAEEYEKAVIVETQYRWLKMRLKRK